MNILVIKQTSLGDVLNATGPIRAIKQQFPQSAITLLTDINSVPIFQNNQWVDEIIVIDRYGIKRKWRSHPIWTIKEILRVRRAVCARQYDLAFDLQGIVRSVLFLYFVKAGRKYVKGNWWGIRGFRDKKLRAIVEMGQVLELAGINARDAAMEISAGVQEKETIDTLLNHINPDSRPILIFSAFTRWLSKDWPLEHFRSVIDVLHGKYRIIMTGTGDKWQTIENVLQGVQKEEVANLAGKLTLLEFVELTGKAELMLSGDSFPMHLSEACKVPVIALFGPTDENRVGPAGPFDRIIRVEDCTVCNLRNCPRLCLKRLSPERVIAVLQQQLGG